MEQKSPDAFRTISEVAEWLGVPTHVLRFWESRFTQVKPVKRAGGRRYYRPADMALLGGIRKLLHEDGLTIRGVQKLLREEGVKHVAGMSPPLDFDPGETAEVISLEAHGDAPTEAPAEDAQSADEAEVSETSFGFEDDAPTSAAETFEVPAPQDDAFEVDAPLDAVLDAVTSDPDEIASQVTRVAEAPTQDASDLPDDLSDELTQDIPDTEIEPAPELMPEPDLAAQDEPADEEPEPPAAEAAVVTSGLLPLEDEDQDRRETVAPFTIVSETPEPAAEISHLSPSDEPEEDDDPLADLDAIAAALDGDDLGGLDADEIASERSLFDEDLDSPSQTGDTPLSQEPEPEVEVDAGPILVMPDIPDDPADGALPPLMAPVSPRLRSLRAQNHALAPAALRTLSDQLKMLAQNRDQRPGI